MTVPHNSYPMSWISQVANQYKKRHRCYLLYSHDHPDFNQWFTELSLGISDPYKGCPGGYIQVSYYKLQIPTTFYSSKNSHSSLPTSSPSYQVLISTISRIPNFHTSNLVQPCENLLYQNHIFVFSTLVNMLKDGN